jgi:hypothetical protein
LPDNRGRVVNGVLTYLHSSFNWAVKRDRPYFLPPTIFSKKGLNFPSLSINVFQAFAEYISAWGKQLRVNLITNSPRWAA